MTSIFDIVNCVFLQQLQKEDEKFLTKTEQKFEERRVMLVIQLRQSNAAMIAEYREEFNKKIDEVLKFRREAVIKEELELQYNCERAVEEQKVILDKIYFEQLTSLGTLCGRTIGDIAELSLSLQGVVKKQLVEYEEDIMKYNIITLAKIKRSAFDLREMANWLDKEVQSFSECDDLHVSKFSGSIRRSNEIFLRLIKDTDAKFRAYLAIEIQSMSDGLVNEDCLTRLVEEHRKERDLLVKSRFDPEDDEFILHNDLINRKIIDRLHSECPGCFGHGHISDEYYKFCGIQHEDGSCAEVENSDLED